MNLDIFAVDSWFHETACFMRGAVVAPNFKDSSLPLILSKRRPTLVDGLEGDIRHGAQGNSYYDDPHDATGRFDFVLANPPFNVNAAEHYVPRIPLPARTETAIWHHT